MLILVEGVDGSGKTTLCKQLVDKCKVQQININGALSEAFDLYEYIYLETGKKSDLLELFRIAQKTKRTYTVHTYIQNYIELGILVLWLIFFYFLL